MGVTGHGWMRKAAAVAITVGCSALLLTTANSYAASSGQSQIMGMGNLCLDTGQQSGHIDLARCGESAQLWTYTSGGTLTSGADSRCLYVSGARNGYGTLLGLTTCNSSDAMQRWAGTSTIRNVKTGLCLDDKWSIPSPGNLVWAYPCNGSNAQRWTVRAVQSSSSTTTAVKSTTSTTAPRPTTTTTVRPTTTTVATGPTTTTTIAPQSNGRAKFEPPDGKVYLGVDTGVNNLATFDQAAGITTHPAILGGYTGGNLDVKQVFQQYVNAQPASVPMVSWNVIFKNNAVANGSTDSYLHSQAAEVKAYGKPIFLRIDWEMNGTWSPNYDSTGGVTPSMYVASWQHIYNLFKQDGVTNAAFVWCPNTGNPAGQPVTAYYPGDQYVDWVSVDGYPEFGNPSSYLTGTNGLNDMANFAASHNKPIMLAEFGPNTTSQVTDNASSLDLVFQWANAYPNTVKAIVYFNNLNFLLNTHPNWAAEWRKVTVGNPKYLLTVTN